MGKRHFVSDEQASEWRETYENGESVFGIAMALAAKGVRISSRRVRAAIVAAGGTILTMKESYDRRAAKRKSRTK